MNQWGLWFTFFVPAFLGGAALGVSAMVALYQYSARKKKARRASTKPGVNASPSACFERCA
jgi:hypothetical protein